HALHYRSSELATPGSTKVILDAKGRFTMLSQRAAELGELLYMDVTVEEREVEAVVQVLREGDEWWRFFQTRHRAAVAFHKRVAKNKKAPRSARRNELEQLHAHLREVRLAKEDQRYRKVMGKHWNAEETDFDALHAVAEWVETANVRLLDAGLD